MLQCRPVFLFGEVESVGKKFKSVGELESFLKDAIQDCMEYEVAEEVKSAMAMWAEPDVYAKYTPKRYERTYSLSNKLFYDAEKVGSMKISVAPHIPFNPYGAVEGESTGMGEEELIHYGDGGGGHRYLWESGDRPYKAPRPWIPDAFADLEGSGSAADALAMGLQAKGISVR